MSKINTFATTTSAFRPLDTTRALRPARIQCPNCASSKDAPILSSRDSLNVEFHHCAECGGAWFYEKDCDLALRAAGACAWPEPKNTAGDQAACSEHTIDWTCPCCSGTLVQIQDRRGSGASIRRCLICYGGWMDHADLKRVAASEAHMFSRVGRIIRQVAFGS